jgi:ankyrin repeat protein
MKHILITTIAAVLLVGCGTTPKDIWEAAEQGDIKAAQQYLDGGADVNAKDGNGRTPLHWVETKEVAELLIAEGADVHAKDEWGFTPLREAAANGHKEIVELLISKGADVNAIADNGATPLDGAIFMKRTEIVELLITNGADVNATSDVGITPLHYAVGEGHKEIVELLIANGADVNAKETGATPLDGAIFLKRTETADLLRKHGGKTSAELEAEGK